MIELDKIQELLGGMEYHLKQFNAHAETLKEIKSTFEYLMANDQDTHNYKLEKIQSEIEHIKRNISSTYKPPTDKMLSFDYIKKTLHTDEWPKAIEPSSICVDVEKIQTRANAILSNIVGENLCGKSFLDFGCGDGSVVEASLEQKPRLSVGYDIDPRNFSNDHCSSELDVVAAKQPYDIILLHDTIDHINMTHLSSVEEVLRKTMFLTHPNTRIYVRAHPWSAKHGGHLYSQINKAYLHLILDEEELSQLGYKLEYTTQLYNCIEVYRNWFKECGYTIEQELITKSKLSQFFIKPSFIKDRLLEKWNGDEIKMINNMEIDFIEYTLIPTGGSKCTMI